MTEEEWLACGDPILSLEAEYGWPSPRKQRLFAVACCQRVKHLLPDDPRWEQALAAAERYAERKAKRADLAPFQTGWATLHCRDRTYADLCVGLAATAVHRACQTRRRAYAAQAATLAASATAYAALPPDEPFVPPAKSRYHQRWSDAEGAERRSQLALLRDVWGDPFRPVTFDADWRTAAAIGIARQMYEARDFSAMPVLADALEQAGCADEQILSHLRGPGTHVRGCFVLDLVLRKA